LSAAVSVQVIPEGYLPLLSCVPAKVSVVTGGIVSLCDPGIPGVSCGAGVAGETGVACVTGVTCVTRVTGVVWSAVVVVVTAGTGVVVVAGAVVVVARTNVIRGVTEKYREVALMWGESWVIASFIPSLGSPGVAL
jgi:hypothetical protein